jgi:hypothetical protein
MRSERRTHPLTAHPVPLPPRSPQVVMIDSADCAWPLLPIRCTHAPDLHAECWAKPLLPGYASLGIPLSGFIRSSCGWRIERRSIDLYVPRSAPRPRGAPRVLRRAERCAEPLSSLPAVLKSQFLVSVGSCSRIHFAVGGKG